MLRLKLQYFGHLRQRADSLEKTLMLGKTEGRRRGWQRTRWLDGITNSPTWVWASSGRWWRTGKPGVLQSMGSQRVRHDWVTGQTNKTKKQPRNQGRASPEWLPTPFWVLDFKSSTCIFNPVSVQCLDMLGEWWLSGDRTQRHIWPSLLRSPLWAEPTQHLHKHSSVLFSFFAKSSCEDSQAAYLVCEWRPVSLQKSDLNGTFFVS